MTREDWTNAELDAEVIALDAKRDGVSLQDFWAFMPTHSYIYAPTHKCGPQPASMRESHSQQKMFPQAPGWINIAPSSR